MMGETFSVTLTSMLTLIMFMTIGFALGKLKIMPENTPGILSKLETNVILPAMVLNVLMTNCTLESLGTQIINVAYGAFATVLAIGLGLVVARLFSSKGYSRNVYTYGLTFSNFGFVGMAECCIIKMAKKG